MLLMASSGFGISNFLENHKHFLERYDGVRFGDAYKAIWKFFGYQLEHVAWTGCTIWDLIQPSFTFMVGAAIPFSFAARAARGDSWLKQFGHAFVRSLILIALGVFLRSTDHSMTNFTFEDTLSQIGLGYLFVFLLLHTRWWGQLAALVVILGGYWFFFFHHPLPPPEGNLVTRYLTEVRHAKPESWNQFTGLAAHWNKHTNAAAEADRVILNYFPRTGTEWEGKKFWINGGGYQTLSFIPTMATMIFGLLAGQLLRTQKSSGQKLQILLGAGLFCFVVAMAVDTTIWPWKPANVNYSYCPIVKRIWTPTWAVFSAGWCFWFLALYYWVIDVWGFRRLAFPLAIVGMNSIVAYVIGDKMMGWYTNTLRIHLTAFDAAAHTSVVRFLYGGESGQPYTHIWQTCAVLFLVWLTCLWLYRRKLFVRI